MSHPSRVALVTGASSGIGRSIAATLGASGFHVLGVARSGRGLERTRALAPAGHFTSITADLREQQAIAALAQRVANEFGRLDALINNAGAVSCRPLQESRPADISDQVAVNLTAPLLLTGSLSGLLQRAPDGNVVNVSSELALSHTRGFVAYGAAKEGLLHMTGALALEMDGRIRINVILPGSVDTDMLSRVTGGRAVPKVSPKEVAEVVKDLATRPELTGTGVLMNGDVHRLFHLREWTLAARWDKTGDL